MMIHKIEIFKENNNENGREQARYMHCADEKIIGHFCFENTEEAKDVLERMMQELSLD